MHVRETLSNGFNTLQGWASGAKTCISTKASRAWSTCSSSIASGANKVSSFVKAHFPALHNAARNNPKTATLGSVVILCATFYGIKCFAEKIGGSESKAPSSGT